MTQRYHLHVSKSNDNTITAEAFTITHCGATAHLPEEDVVRAYWPQQVSGMPRYVDDVGENLGPGQRKEVWVEL
jgi:hypothetical protein